MIDKNKSLVESWLRVHLIMAVETTNEEKPQKHDETKS